MFGAMVCFCCYVVSLFVVVALCCVFLFVVWLFFFCVIAFCVVLYVLNIVVFAFWFVLLLSGVCVCLWVLKRWMLLFCLRNYIYVYMYMYVCSVACVYVVAC